MILVKGLDKKNVKKIIKFSQLRTFISSPLIFLLNQNVDGVLYLENSNMKKVICMVGLPSNRSAIVRLVSTLAMRCCD